LRSVLPTNPDPASSGGSLLAEAKAAIVVGDRTQALALLNGVRARPVDEGRQLPPAFAEALVATAREDVVANREALSHEYQEARTALHQIIRWISALQFGLLLRFAR
jgi:hypothetical protein